MDRKTIQTCNMILITFMILFSVVGIMNSSRTVKRNKIAALDKQLDVKEIRLKDYEKQLGEYEMETTDYQRLREEYEELYDDYMQIFEERQALYKNFGSNKIEIDSEILFMGVGVLAVVMVILNLTYAVSKKR